MINTLHNHEQVSAIGRLYEFAANKRFHIIHNEFINDQIGLKAIEINNTIKRKEGLDLFEISQEKDLNRYELILNGYTTDLSNTIFGVEEVGDQIELLKVETGFSVDRIKALNISVAKQLKEPIKQFNLIIPDLTRFCKDADFASFISESNSFFISKKINLKNRDKIILIHAAYHEPEMTQEKGSQTLGAVRSIDDPKSISHLMIRSFFFFDFDEYSFLIHRPVSLFIKGIDLYAKEVTINGRYKKFYRNLLLPPHVSTQTMAIKYIDDIIKKNRGEDINSVVVTLIRPSILGVTLILFYVINYQKVRVEFNY